MVRCCQEKTSLCTPWSRPIPWKTWRKLWSRLVGTYTRDGILQAFSRLCENTLLTPNLLDSQHSETRDRDARGSKRPPEDAAKRAGQAQWDSQGRRQQVGTLATSVAFWVQCARVVAAGGEGEELRSTFWLRASLSSVCLQDPASMAEHRTTKHHQHHPLHKVRRRRPHLIGLQIHQVKATVGCGTNLQGTTWKIGISWKSSVFL